MPKRCLSMLLMMSLTLTLCSVNAFGRSSDTPEGKVATEAAAAATARRNERLKTSTLKLVVDAKAETNHVTIRPQSQVPHSNNLSTGQKVAIGVGIAITVLVVAIIAARNSGPDGSFPIFGT